MNPSYPQPVWRVVIDGQDITGTIRPRLIDMSLTDNRGLEADQLDINLDDSDGRLDIPPRGAEIAVWMGWSNVGLIDKGIYTVDEVEHSGTPDQLTIRARSADLREGLATKKERSWHQTTVGAIVTQIAEDNELTPRVSPDLAGEPVAHLDQTSESDGNLLTRLAEMFDAVATVKAGLLLFFRIGQGITFGGQVLDTIHIRRQDGDRHRFSAADREACTAVRACYYDTRAGKKGEVLIKREKDSKGKPVEHSADNTKTLRHTYASKANATRGAKAALDKSARGVSTFSLTLAKGWPELFPELPATVSGWKPIIDGTDWLLSKVTHRLNPSGLVTELELELALDGDEEDQIEEA